MKKIRLVILFMLLVAFFATSTAPILAASKTIVNPKQKYTYSEMVRDIKKLQKKYPKIIQAKVIGKSEYGRNIYAVGLGPNRNNPSIPCIFINGSHHGREWLTTNLNMNLLEQYAIAYNAKRKIGGYNVRSILTNATIWFVPMVNPDGVTLAQSGLKHFPKKDHKKLIRMNGGSKKFARWKANGKGIDLNRHYNIDWNKARPMGVKSPHYQHYKGKKAETAAETKALLKFVNGIKPTMAVSYHSAGKVLYWNYKQNKEDYARDKSYAKTIRKLTGYRLKGDTSKESAAGMSDWFIAKQKIPAFTPEIGYAKFESSPPVREFKNAWKENYKVGLYLANEAIKLDAKWKNVTNPLITLKAQIAALKTNAEKPLLPNEQIEPAFVSSIAALKASQTKLPTQLANFNKLPPYRKAGLSFTNLSKELSGELKKAENYIAIYNRGVDLLTQTNSFTSNPTQESAADLQTKLEAFRLLVPSLATANVKAAFTTKFILPVEEALHQFDNTQKPTEL